MNTRKENTTTDTATGYRVSSAKSLPLRLRLLFAHTLYITAAFLFFCCASTEADYGTSETDQAWVAALPGLREADGSVHSIPAPHIANGRTLSVLDYGADAADNQTDDRPAIEAAMNAASYGDELYFPAGTYNLKSPWSTDVKANIRLKSGVNLRGENRERVILKTSFDDVYSSAKPAGTNNYYVIAARGVHDIQLSGFTISSEWNRAYSSSSSENSVSHGGPNRCIDLSVYSTSTESNYNISIIDITVEKFLNIGINVGPGSRDVRVSGCLARLATDLGGGGCGYGFQIAGAFAGNGLASNPHLGTPRDTYFNILENSSTEGPYIRHAALIQYWAHNNLITNCTFDGALLDAIDLHGEDEYNNEVSHNSISNCTNGAGIGIGNSGGTSVIHDKSGPHNWIHHNTISASYRGITIQYGTTHCLIEENSIRGATRSNSFGILLGSTAYNILRANRIENNPATSFIGIYLRNEAAMGLSPAGSPSHNQFIENSIVNNPSGSAITVAAGSNNHFTANIAHGNQDNSIAGQ